MATLQTVMRLAFQGGAETRKQLEDIAKGGDAAKAAFDRMAASGQKVPAQLRAIDAAAGQVKGNLEGVAARLGSVGTAANALGPIGTVAAASAVGVGALATALGKMAYDAAGAADELNDLSDLTGISTRTLQAYGIAAGTAGVNQQAFSAAMLTFTKNVGDAELGTGRFAGKLKTLDPEFLALINRTGTVEEKFDLVVQKINELPTSAERASLAIAAFGDQGAKIANVGATVAEVTEKYEALGAVIGEDLLRAAGAAGDALDESTAILQAQVLELQTQATPAILQFEKAWVDGASRIVAGLRDILVEIGLINKSAGESFSDLSVRRAQLSAELAKINADTGRGLETGASSERRKDLEAEIAALDVWQKRIRERQKSVERLARTEQDAARTRAQGEQDRLKAERERAAAEKKAASAAESAAKRAATVHEQGLKKLQDLRDKDTTSALDAISKIEAERDIAYREWAEQAAAANLTQEQLAEGYFLIWSDAEKRITAEREKEIEERAEQEEKARRDALRAQREAEREALEAGRRFVRESAGLGQAGAFFGLDRESMAELFKGGQADAEAFAENLEGIMDNVWGSIGALGRDALRDLFQDGELDAQAFADALKDIIFQALLDIAGQQIILPIIAQVVGATGVGGGAGASSGLGGIVNTGQQIVGFGQTLKSGFDLLTGALGSSAAASGMLASDIAALTASGITLVPSTAALTASEAALLFPSGVVPASFGGGGLGGAGAGVGGAGAGASIATGASTLGIAIAVVAAIEGIMGLKNVQKTRDAAFGNADTREAFMAAFDPFTRTIANVTAYLGGMQSANNLMAQQQRILFGGASVMDAAMFSSSLASPLGPMLLPLLAFTAFTKPPTKGTALRKSFEEFIESDDLGAGFFTRDSGTFKRGIGQTGLSANDVHGGEILRARLGSIGQGARGIQDATGLDFVAAQKEFIRLQQESIGLTDQQLQQVTGLGAAFRALVSKKAGQEETRVFGLIADFLGSINAEGADAAETMDIVAQAVAGLGRPAEVFDTLNEFFTSSDNDIGVETYRDAIQGLAAALFTDLPQGVDAAALALRELDEAGNGNVTFEQIQDRIESAVAEAEALGPALKDAFVAGFNDVDLNVDDFGTEIFDSIESALKEAIATAVFDGFIEGAFTGDILGPFMATFQDTIKKVKSGELTQDEGNRILAAAAADARDNLELLRPLILSAVEAGKSLASVFDDAADAAEGAAEAIAKARAGDAFKGDINRQLLGILDPQLGRQFDQEVIARQRLAQARELGLDLTKVERLNELERIAIAEDAAEQRTRIEEQAAEQIERIRDSFFDGVRRSLESLQDLVQQFTASPSSPLPPEEALANAQSELDALFAAAEAGDADALAKLPEAFQNAVGLAEALYGSTDAFFALFNPWLTRMEKLGGADAGAFQLSDDAQAQIAAITEQKDEQLATLNEHHDEAMALWQEMLDALTLNEQGQDVSQGGGSPGDQVSVPIVGGTAGQYGLSESESVKLQTVLGGAKRGGDIQTEVLAMIEAGDFGGKYGSLLAELFEGAVSRNGKLRVLRAINDKINDPSTFQPVLGFGAGGSFMVTGTGAGDIYPLPVRVAPRETVTVTTHGMDAKLGELVAATRQANDTTRRLLAENAAIRAELAALRLTYQQQSARYVPGGAR